MHTLPTKYRVALVEVVQVPNTLTPEHLEGARRCAAFMHEHLPEHFKDPAEMVMVGGYVLVDITLRMLQPPELKRAQGFDESYIIDRGLLVDPVTGAELSSRFSLIRRHTGPSTNSPQTHITPA